MRHISHLAVAIVLFGTTAGAAFATPSTSYTTTVHLRDSKQVVCAVNEPAALAQQATGQTLTRRERNEAQIDATARLSSAQHSKNDYPSPATAPRVHCS
ncbi:cell division protein FtsB [Paraburkholderia sp. UCT70]|uniref:hypothetical protein n=1 Tax=Paraburkholderia sp. UCT70 TaxID=2991068 RepID=UPI003D247B48